MILFPLFLHWTVNKNRKKHQISKFVIHTIKVNPLKTSKFRVNRSIKPRYTLVKKKHSFEKNAFKVIATRNIKSYTPHFKNP